MLDLRKYGIRDEWPELVKRQQEVANLERRRSEAEGNVAVARNAIERAKEQDAEAAAKALRAGKAMPSAKAQAKAQDDLAEAERMHVASSRAVEAAQTDLGAYQARHAGEIRASLSRALRDKARRLAAHATEAVQLYGQLEDSRYDLRRLTPPAPTQEFSGPPQNITTVIGYHGTDSSRPDRGNVEAMLAYLANLTAEFSVPAENEGSDAA
jgi:hypothetical protein